MQELGGRNYRVREAQCSLKLVDEARAWQGLRLHRLIVDAFRCATVSTSRGGKLFECRTSVARGLRVYDIGIEGH